MRFRTLDHNASEPLRFEFDGRAIHAQDGQTLAAALLAAGIVSFRRSARTGAPRGPFCLMGACFDCLVHVEGEGSRQACATAARPGMKVSSTGSQDDTML